MGTDEDTLTRILGNAAYTPEQIQEICDIYQEEYGSSLLLHILNDTDGKYYNLLETRLNAAKNYIKNTLNDDVQFNRETPFNLAEGEIVEEKDDAGNTVKRVYNANGDLLYEETIPLVQEDGTSKIVKQYVYDENGQLREQVDIRYDEQGNEKSFSFNRKDEQGRDIQLYTKYQTDNGNFEERSVEYLYNCAEDSSLCTQSRESYSYYKDGELFFKGEKESISYQTYLIGEASQKYGNTYQNPYYAEIILNLNKYSIEELENLVGDGEKLYTDWYNSTLTQSFDTTVMSQEASDMAYKEMLAKADLIAYDFHIDSPLFETKEELIEKIELAYKSGDFEQLSKLYEEVNRKVFPSDNQQSLASELVSMGESRAFYEEYGVEQAKQDMTIREDYDPAIDDPETYGEKLLEQLYEVEQQYALYKSNGGTLDRTISFMNRALDLELAKMM